MEGGRITAEFSEGRRYHVVLEGEVVDLLPELIHRGVSAAAGESSCGTVRAPSAPAAAAACTQSPGTIVAERHLRLPLAVWRMLWPGAASRSPCTTWADVTPFSSRPRATLALDSKVCPPCLASLEPEPERWDDATLARGSLPRPAVRSRALQLVRRGRGPDLHEPPCGAGVPLPSQ
jgi:hypothetical protein